MNGSGAEIAQAFAEAERQLRRRVERFLSLPPEALDGPDVRVRLEAIGKDLNP